MPLLYILTLADCKPLSSWLWPHMLRNAAPFPNTLAGAALGTTLPGESRAVCAEKRVNP